MRFLHTNHFSFSCARVCLLIAAASVAVAPPAAADPLVIEAGTQGSLATYAKGQFRVRKTNNSVVAQSCGEPGSIPTPGTYLSGGVGKYAVWNPSTAVWKVCDGLTSTSRQWGLPNDIPAPGDFNGDGLTDYVTFRPQSGEWYQQLNTGGVSSGPQTVTQFGLPGDLPVASDYDGDTLADRAVFRANTTNGGTDWYVAQSGGGTVTQQYGLIGDVPVQAAYEVAGDVQFAVWRPSNGTWYIRQSGGTTLSIQFGLPGDIPSPADLNNDGLAELVVYRPSSSTFFYRQVAANSPTLVFVLGTVGSAVANDSRSAVVERRAPLDYNGDRVTDLAVYRLSSGSSIELLLSTGTAFSHPTPKVAFGQPGDILAPGDFDGDGLTDHSVVANVNPYLEWRILRSSLQDGGRNEIRVLYGLIGDQVIPADYDGDRKTDLAVVRNLSNGQKLWIPTPSSIAQLTPVSWGLIADRAFTADFDGDGRSDYAVVRVVGNQLYWFIRTQAGVALPTKIFGLSTDAPFVCECTGDRKAEVGVVRVTGGVRTVFLEGAPQFVWGLTNDVSLFGGYSGRVESTAAVWRLVGGQGYFLIRQPVSGMGSQPFGVPGDMPLRPFTAVDTG